MELREPHPVLSGDGEKEVRDEISRHSDRDLSEIFQDLFLSTLSKWRKYLERYSKIV